MSARSCNQIEFARTRLSALLFPRFLNPPWVHGAHLALPLHWDYEPTPNPSQEGN